MLKQTQQFRSAGITLGGAASHFGINVRLQFLSMEGLDVVTQVQEYSGTKSK